MALERNPVVYRRGVDLAKAEVKALYDSEGWTNYTGDMPRLMQALANSLYVLTAWDGDELIGLVRTVGDGLTIVYIQDIIVRDTHRRRGIGTCLMERVLERYSDVRQKVLLTDEGPAIRAFYESLGFESCDGGGLVAFARLEKL